MSPSVALQSLGSSRPIRSGELRVPRQVWTRGDRLYWSLEQGYVRRSAGPAMLDSFLELADAEPDGFERFAGKWGCFGLCRHGLPYMHTATASAPCRPRRDRYGFWEPLSDWRNAAGKFRTAVRLAAALHQGERGTPEDWERFGLAAPPARRSKHGTMLAGYVTGQLVYGRVQPVASWSESGFSMEYTALGTPNSFGHLALQLALAVARSEGLANCSSCGAAYVPTGRKPAAGKRAYCKPCSDSGAPSRDASRDYRRRKRES